MSSPNDAIFLARRGQIFGPYLRDDLHMMEKDGRLSQFTWIWEPRSEIWIPVDPMPTTRPETSSMRAPLPPMPPRPETNEEAHQARPLAAIPVFNCDGIEAVCLDRQTALSGRITRADATGCDFTVEGGSSPAFMNQSRLLLNLLDARSEQTMSISARLEKVQRQGSLWTYRLSWKTVPELLTAA